MVNGPGFYRGFYVDLPLRVSYSNIIDQSQAFKVYLCCCKLRMPQLPHKSIHIFHLHGVISCTHAGMLPGVQSFLFGYFRLVFPVKAAASVRNMVWELKLLRAWYQSFPKYKPPCRMLLQVHFFYESRLAGVLPVQRFQ